MDAAIGQQWLDVQFKSGITMAAARHAVGACEHVPGVRLQSVTPDPAVTGTADSARYNVTAASDADMARLQLCLQRHPSIVGVTLNEAGGY